MRKPFRVIITFGTDAWQAALDEWLEARKTLAAKWARDREMQMIPVTVAPGREIALSPGAHSELIKNNPRLVRAAFRFPVPRSSMWAIPETRSGFSRKERLASLGVTVDRHGKMPDVVLYFGEKALASNHRIGH